ncbi:MAG: TadE/TadG family type IV pilus assembly protein [Thermodesulfobacteriota bacterium]
MMPAKKRPGKSRRETGSVVMEMALVLPVLLLMVAGTIDIGLLFWEKEVLTNAAREGARAAARAQISGRPEQTTKAAVMAIVQAYLNNYNLRDDSGVPITLVNGTNFIYEWDFGNNPPILSVELKDIPVKMLMLPNVSKPCWGTFSNVYYLNAKTTMAPQWLSTFPPT